MEKLLAYVGGSERCGSTLLDLILNNSPHVQSVGEVSRLCWYAQTNREPCTCGTPVSECEFWRRVEVEGCTELGLRDGEPLLRTRETMLWPEHVGRLGTVAQKCLLVLGNRPLYLTAARVLTSRHHEACQNSLFWYEMLRRVTGCPIILDSSKDARRLKALYLTDPQPFRLLHMVRDGRAIVASAMRRKNFDVLRATKAWVKITHSLRWVMRTVPERQVLRVHYESLCRDPHRTTERVCDFLQIPFDAEMLTLRKHDAHNIGGNPMRFRKLESQITLDEQWRRQLSAEDLATFERLAGRWNRHLGYQD